MTVPFHDSGMAKAVLASVKAALDEGFEKKLLQSTPHTTLISKDFYHSHLKGILAKVRSLGSPLKHR